MAKETNKVEANNTNAESSKKPAKVKKNKSVITFYSIVGVLAIVTVAFGYSVLNYFVLTPTKHSGQPVYGYRIDNLPEVNDAQVATVESFGKGLSGVDSVSVNVKGPVIYFDVRVPASTELATAQELAEQVANKLIETVTVKEDGKTIADFYELQLVVSNEDLDTLLDTNRESEEAYILEHDTAIVEKAVERAEQYPTANYIQKANANISYLEANSELRVALEARVAALKELTAEEEEAMEIPTIEIDMDIAPSNLADYPSWGTMNSASGKFEWH